MQNASIIVKSKRIYEMMQIASMSFDDRPDPAKRLEQARLGAGFTSAREAAIRFGWKYETYVQHENGTRGITRSVGRYAKAYRVSEAWLLTGEGGAPTDPDLEILRLLLPHINGAGRRALVASAEAMAGRDAEPIEGEEPDLRPSKQARTR